MSILDGLPPLSLNVKSVFNSATSAAGLTFTNPLGSLQSVGNALANGLGISNPFGSPASGPVWGVFDQDGTEILVAESILSFDYRNDWNVSNYPQEKGAFASYNKVNNPYDVRLRISQGGTEDQRTAFLAAAQTVADSLDLYDVVTPEATYSNCNIVHIDYHREQHEGATRIALDVWFQEIRQVSADVGMAEDNTQSINSPDAIIAGQVQALVPTVAQIRTLI
jgi:Dit-like tail protein